MARRWIIAIALLLLSSPVAAAPVLRDAVLVLPLHAAAGLDPALGVATQNVLENVTALDGQREPCWAQWHLRKIFASESAYRSWVRSQDAPPALDRVDARYVVQGTLLGGPSRLEHPDGLLTVSGFRIHLILTDRASGRAHERDVPVDAPGLAALREGFIALLGDAGLSPTTAQAQRMLWKEDLPLPALSAMGRGLLTIYPDDDEEERRRIDLAAFEEARRVAPTSYLAADNLAWAIYRVGRYQDALPVFRAALALDPDGVDAADGLVWTGLRLDDAKLAEEGARLEARLLDWPAERMLARLPAHDAARADDRKDYAAAEAAWRRAATLDPGDARHVCNAADALAHQGKHAEAVALVTAALPGLRNDGERREARVELAWLEAEWASALDKQGDEEGAAAHYGKAVALDRDVRPRALAADLRSLSIALRHAKQLGASLAAARDAAKVDAAAGQVEDEASDHLAIALTLEAQQRWSDAARAYEQALALGQGSKWIPAAAHAGAARALREAGRIDDALSHYEIALSLAPAEDDRGRYGVLFQYGLTFLRAGRPAEALSKLSDAAAIARRLDRPQDELDALSFVGLAQERTSDYGGRSRPGGARSSSPRP